MMCFCFCSSLLIITIYVLSVDVMRYAFLLRFHRSFSLFLCALVCAHLVPFSLFVMFCFVCRRYFCDFPFASVRTLNGTNTKPPYHLDMEKKTKRQIHRENETRC